MNDSTFTGDKREIVVNAIRRIDPEFRPKYTPPDITYKNCLLDALNNNIQSLERNDFPVIFIVFLVD